MPPKKTKLTQQTSSRRDLTADAASLLREVEINPAMKHEDERRTWLLEQYKTHVDLYKQYLDITVKFDAFYYIATGAILSFYFTRTKNELGDHPDIRLSLLFPIAMSLVFALLYFIGYRELRDKIKVMGEIVKHLSREEGTFALKTVPNFNILGVFLILAALFKVIIAVTLGLYYAYGRL